MALQPGDQLGSYRVTALIGEGGMGQVYRATDTQLNRDVALKILPDAFAADPDRLARFQQEAQVLASLNHPNIAAIYGIEQSDNTRALVLELVEGPTLADRIGQGPIPLDEALPIAKQIAEALEAAHEAGVGTGLAMGGADVTRRWHRGHPDRRLDSRQRRVFSRVTALLDSHTDRRSVVGYEGAIRRRVPRWVGYRLHRWRKPVSRLPPRRRTSSTCRF